MFFETGLSDKLNNELESAGISVSEALIAKTLVAVQAARTTEENKAPDDEWTEATEENINKLIELADARRGRIRGAGQALFRVAAVMAACFVLVVGGFALRFSTMRMGKDEAAPIATAENSSARNSNLADGAGIATAKDSTTEYKVEMESEAEVPMMPMESIVADDADAVEESDSETVTATDPVIAQSVTELTDKLTDAVEFEQEVSVQGTIAYRFVVEEADGTEVCYRIQENGAVEFAEVMSNGETGALWPYEGAENKEFRRAVLVWLKQNGY